MRFVSKATLWIGVLVAPPLPPGNPHARDPVLPPDRETTPPAA